MMINHFVLVSGRITDLKVLMLESGQLVATWTAPGDDYDAGSVSGYRFVVADNISHLLNPNSDQRTLAGMVWVAAWYR